MSLLGDLKILYHLTLSPVRGQTHAERLDSFYRGQAEGYDRFRQRLLHGRRELFEALPAPAGGVWVDIGGGTGENIEHLGERRAALSKVYIVDLASSLLEVAQARIERQGWKNVSTLLADATHFDIPERQADVVSFSYSLTMIPDWFAALEQAYALLRPGGYLGVVDFYVSRKHAELPRVRHSGATRSFWPWWFGNDNVYLSADHLPYLLRRFEPQLVFESRAKVPYVPLGRVPYYRFVGRKSSAVQPSASSDVAESATANVRIGDGGGAEPAAS